LAGVIVTKNVVILGAGFAGMNVARHLERLARPDELSVTIVSRENYMLFTPMLPEVSSGSIAPRHIAPPLRAILPETAFELGEITGVDFATRVVALRRLGGEGNAELPFDQLVVALGAENSTHGVPGAAEHTIPLKNLQDAVKLRDVAITALENAATTPDDSERAALMTFVVIGGGFSGVETAGELLAFLRSATRFYPRIRTGGLRVVLVAGGPRLLEQLPAELGALAQDMLGRRGVEVVLEDEVASVDRAGVTLKSGKCYATRCAVWSAGVRPSSLAAALQLAHSPHHAIEVNADFSVPGSPGIWALGDCARVPQAGGGACPQTAQHAVHQAKRLASNILATFRDRQTQPYGYRVRGMMASLGAREGLAKIGNVKIGGLPAWFLWRAYYLSQLPGIDRKARVLLDWTLDFPFPGDIASVR
jgi:NADH dehydrogenase